MTNFSIKGYTLTSVALDLNRDLYQGYFPAQPLQVNRYVRRRQR